MIRNFELMKIIFNVGNTIFIWPRVFYLFSDRNVDILPSEKDIYWRMGAHWTKFSKVDSLWICDFEIIFLKKTIFDFKKIGLNFLCHFELDISKIMWKLTKNLNIYLIPLMTPANDIFQSFSLLHKSPQKLFSE